MAIVNNCTNLNDYLNKKTNISKHQKPCPNNYLKNNKFLIDLTNDIELYERVAQDIEEFNKLYENMIEDTIKYEFGRDNKKLELYVKSRLF